ncbi:NACHT, LRR and PYD domains-containing protein 3 isoform X2 [Microcaecilia unicolor]|uniref:NACHT, LRR and PYD domains-containing protein 3-like isoform X2 n=1 Tax=Microcaecilia unicolor TaxID=1415580 RepID=A0A6P7XGL3_9AMPH|nr:NACHT, LRR and PYD domains-containing protein 3-like isoform X2 [Microcaecilia unicolor]
MQHPSGPPGEGGCHGHRRPHAELLWRRPCPSFGCTGLTVPVKPVKEPEISCQVLYKAAIKQKFEKLKDYNSLPGDWVYLQERYIDLLIIKKHCTAAEKEEALLCYGQTHLEMLNKFHEGGSARAQLETFLDTERGRAPLVVILQGAAGIGKTYTVRKMMLDWASDQLYQDRFDYVFHLNLKELGCEKRLVSLRDLMLANWQGLQPFLDQILTQPQRLLFLLDGYDELKSLLSEEEEEVQAVCMSSQYPAVVIVNLILKRQLVPGSCLLITTRPTALDRLESYIQADCYLEVLGFLEEERQAFFYSYFRDDQQALEAYQAIKGNNTISTMCFVPLVCWIVCTVLKQQMKKDRRLDDLHTTTQIFLYFIQILLRYHHYYSLKNSTQASARVLFQKLGSLALHGILSQKVIFEKEDLEAHFLEGVEIPTIFLNTMLRQNLLVETLYSFGHVTLQEFFSAMFFFVTSEKTQKLNQLLEEGLKAESGHLLLTIRFLFGLSNPRSYRMLEQLVFFQQSSATASSTISEEELLSWIQKAACSPRINDPHFHLELLHCLYELHQDSFVRRAMLSLDNLSFLMFPLKRSDCLVLAYCIQCCETVQNLNLYGCSLGVEEVRHLLPVLKKCLLLQLEMSNLPNIVLREICSSFSPQQSVTCILVTGSISPSGKRETMFKCSAKQGSETCRLQIRFLPEEDTVACCSWIIPKHCPQEIILKDTQLSNHGLWQICMALSANKCPVYTLRISGNQFTKSCIPDFSSFLVTNPYLAQLDLSGNQLQDEAVILLCSALQAAEMGSLQYLSLEENGLTEACIPEVSCLLTATSSLSYVKLGFNKLGDKGAQRFWPVLSDPLCQLEKLGMEANELTDACVDSLVICLLHNQSLCNLYLDHNSLTMQSVPSLDVIWKECSMLHTLSLSKNQIPKQTLRNYSMFYNGKSKKKKFNSSPLPIALQLQE